MFAIDYDTAPFDPDGPTQADLSTLPKGLATMPPGAELAVLLAGIDVAGLSGYDQVIVLEAEHRQASHYQGRAYRTMAAIADTYQTEAGVGSSEAYDLAAGEIGAALHLTRRAAETELSNAWDLTNRFPQVHTAMHSGALDRRQAVTILRNAGHLQDHHLAAVVDAVMETASQLTTGQLRARIRKLAFSTDPESARRRYDQAVGERRVELRAEPEGTATLIGYDLPPTQAQAAANHLNTIARHLKNQGDPRTLDQIRAVMPVDAGVDRAISGSPDTIAGTPSGRMPTSEQDHPGQARVRRRPYQRPAHTAPGNVGEPEQGERGALAHPTRPTKPVTAPPMKGHEAPGAVPQPPLRLPGLPHARSAVRSRSHHPLVSRRNHRPPQPRTPLPPPPRLEALGLEVSDRSRRHRPLDLALRPPLHRPPRPRRRTSTTRSLTGPGPPRAGPLPGSARPAPSLNPLA